MENKSNKFITLVFCLIIGLMFLSYIFTGEKTFSANENRYLKSMPQLSFDNLVSGAYSQGLEDYVNDQFPLREEAIALKTRIQALIGNKDINNVYLAQDDYLIERVLEKDFNYELLNKNIENINKFTARFEDQNKYLAIAPTSALVLEDKLPSYASNFDQDQAIDSIKNKLKDADFVDLRPGLLKEKDQYIYYRTDHHWTSLGAFYAYQSFMEDSGQKIELSDYSLDKVTDSFKGTLYSKLLMEDIKKDEIELVNKDDQSYKVSYNFGRQEAQTIYDLSKLKEKDKYQVFLKGNHPELRISGPNKNKKNILVIKDSFANSFIPYMIKDFENIHVIDPRHYNGNIDQYIEENQISDILILYNILNFSNDNNIVKLASKKD